jgi:TonB family protein
VNPSSSPDTLFAMARRPGRSWGAVATSAVLHAAVIAAGVSVARSAVLAPAPRVTRVLTFVSVFTPPVPVFVAPLKPLPLPPLVEETPRPIETAPARLESPPIPERHASIETPVEPKPPAPEPRRETPIKVAPPKPPVMVGMFETSAPSAHAPEAARTVERAGFDAPTAIAPEIKLRTAAVGTFDQAPVRAFPQPGSDQPRVVADAGFGAAVVPAPAQPRTRALADAGFSARNDAAPASRPQRVVQTTDFDAKPAPPTTAAAPRAPRIDVPLEILSKPTPAYTDEARTLKLEGDVLLDVRFAASGEIQVLGVVRGLGHGLDESATKAAQGIRFKPAQSSGHPIDFRTTVHIVFRLA